MVSWQTFVAIAFDEAKAKGATFQGIDEGGDFMEDVARVWQSDKERYKQMTEQQARNAIKDMVSA
jgi:uncharacterized protein YbjQ (UPF0145 family)